MSSPISASNGMVLATAMAAVSGTVLLLAFRLQKQPIAGDVDGAGKFPITHHPRSCISIDGKKREKKKKKKVHFAEDVMEPSGNGEEFRRLKSKNFHKPRTSSSLFKDEGGKKKIMKDLQGMPANRIALYSGILRDRGIQRLAYS